MILKTKDEILNWLEKNDSEYKDNIRNNAYEFIDMHDIMNSSLLKELIKKDNLPLDYFEELKLEGHQYIINVKMSVDISKNSLEIIPIQFYHVDCNFFCSYNQLFCSYNQLTSLKGCPKHVSKSFDCSYNQLKSLEYCSKIINDGFSCSYNQLTSLQYCPKHIGGHFYCHHNQLTSLEYCPQSISGDFDCSHNQLTSLEYFSEIINGDSYLVNNEKLLKYKKESQDKYINNMTDNDFCHQRDFSFWKLF